jgi:acyl carrier protein
MSNDAPRSALATKVRRFLLENYLFTNDESALNDGDSLLQKGVVDSTGMMELIAFLEGEFDIAITDAEMVPENLDSVDAIVRFLNARRMALPAATGGAA